MEKVPKLLTISDICTRWDMPRQSIHERIKYREFPKPIQYVSNERTAIFLESDIENFEKSHKWIQTPELREWRQKFIFSLITSEDYKPKN